MSEISSVELGLIGCIEMTLTEVAKKLAGNGSNKDWTRECLKALAGLGMDIGYGVCPDPANMKGEWLYDLIWYKEEERSGQNLMTDVALALESEWSTYFEDIRYDFQKLVQAKSRLKILISRELTKEEFAMLKQDIECFQRKDGFEIYVFAEYIGDEKNPFGYEIYQCGECWVAGKYDVGKLMSIVSEKAQLGSEISIECSSVTDVKKANTPNVDSNDLSSFKIHFTKGVASQVQMVTLKVLLEEYASGFGRWLLAIGPYVVIVWVAHIAKAVLEVIMK